VLIAVVDAQAKSKNPTEEIVEKSIWWKKFKKKSKDL
jgi:malate dehydrogenase (oxaloacetate-decarboxylating)(NADP+)